VRDAVATAGLDRCRLISTVHHIVDLPQVSASLEADMIMVVCRKYLDLLLEYGVPREKLVLVYNGVDADLLRPTDTSVARKTLDVPNDAFVVGFAGKATSDHDGRKGVDVLCRVLARLPESTGRPVHVVLTGPGWELLREESRFSGLFWHHYPFLPRPKMVAFYNALDVYLVTARAEGGPVPLLEAMSCGVPVVTTQVGTALDFILDGDNGLTVPIGDVSAAVHAVVRLSKDTELAARLRIRGRQTILEHLQWKQTVQAIGALYGDYRRTKAIGPRPLLTEALKAELISRDSARWLAKVGGEGRVAYDTRTPSRPLGPDGRPLSRLKRLRARLSQWVLAGLGRRPHG
jgi:glycosyltransferase involved in cell wall biosynthesis